MFKIYSTRIRFSQSVYSNAVASGPVIHAYGGRCAVSEFPEPLLLDAAHIVPDKHEPLGQPVIPNGLPLSKLRHAVFDRHLFGIAPNYRLS